MSISEGDKTIGYVIVAIISSLVQIRKTRSQKSNFGTRKDCKVRIRTAAVALMVPVCIEGYNLFDLLISGRTNVTKLVV